MPTPIIADFVLPAKDWGITEEPRTTRYFDCYFDALGAELHESVALLDYGCGCGRLANYLSARLDRFTYWGIEQDNEFGDWSIRYGRTLFGHDPRVRLGLAGSQFEEEALDQASAAVLSSVFTHLPFGDFERLMLRLEPVWRRGAVVFSCFLADRYQLHSPGIFGPGTFFASFYTAEQLSGFAEQRNMKLTECARIFVDYDHVIYRAEAL